MVAVEERRLFQISASCIVISGNRIVPAARGHHELPRENSPVTGRVQLVEKVGAVACFIFCCEIINTAEQQEAKHLFKLPHEAEPFTIPVKLALHSLCKECGDFGE